MTLPSPDLSDPTADLYQKAVDAYYAGRFDIASAHVDGILAHAPEHAHAMHLGGLSLLALGDAEAAQRWVARALAVAAEPNFYNTLYSIQFKLGAFNDAIESLRRGLTLAPDFAAFHYNLAWALQQLDVLDQAVISYRRALELDPDNASIHNNLGFALQELGAPDTAEFHYRRAIALVPDKPTSRHNLGRTLLAKGQYDEAWPYYEDRWVSQQDSNGRPCPVPIGVSLPRWRGEKPNPSNDPAQPYSGGESLLVLHEQGLGDSLHFVRYLPLALERFSRVGYVCPPSLRRLYEQSLCSRWPGIVLLDSVPADLGDWNWHCPMMSLPLAFQTRIDTIPAEMPYLYADTSRVTWWRARLDDSLPRAMPRVGIVWAGGHSIIDFDKRRSLTSALIAPLLSVSNVGWVSLQKTDDDAKRPDEASKAQLLDWTDELHDFAETAALIENLDLVISVDTSVAHLAAAMDKPVWLLNRFPGCWRWMNGTKSPWYPGLRLFTQSERGNWDDVLARVVAALQEEVVRQAP